MKKKVPYLLLWDGKAYAHLVKQEKLRLITFGHSDTVTDFGNLNPGRPNNKYIKFFQKMAGIVEGMAEADDRRHWGSTSVRIY